MMIPIIESFFDSLMKTSFVKTNLAVTVKSKNYTWGQFHKTLQIRKLRICSYGQILTVNLLINCKNSVIYGKMAVNYEEKCFMEQASERKRL